MARCSVKNSFSEGIKKLVQRWKKRIEKQGDYVEKWCYYKFSIFIEIKFISVLRIIIDSPTYMKDTKFQSEILQIRLQLGQLLLHSGGGGKKKKGNFHSLGYNL